MRRPDTDSQWPFLAILPVALLVALVVVARCQTLETCETEKASRKAAEMDPEAQGIWQVILWMYLAFLVFWFTRHWFSSYRILYFTL